MKGEDAAFFPLIAIFRLCHPRDRPSDDPHIDSRRRHGVPSSPKMGSLLRNGSVRGCDVPRAWNVGIATWIRRIHSCITPLYYRSVFVSAFYLYCEIIRQRGMGESSVSQQGIRRSPSINTSVRPHCRALKCLRRRFAIRKAKSQTRLGVPINVDEYSIVLVMR